MGEYTQARGLCEQHATCNNPVALVVYEKSGDGDQEREAEEPRRPKDAQSLEKNLITREYKLFCKSASKADDARKQAQKYVDVSVRFFVPPRSMY
eukprot:COSAG05_NODE_348_length_10944_cov_10.258368_6_plen_95_part_00